MTDESVPGFALVVPPVRSKQELALSKRFAAHIGMKSVPENTVAQVIQNEPMPRIPRENDVPIDADVKEQLLRVFFENIFPHMQGFRADFRISNATDEDLDAEVAETIRHYQSLGLTDEIPVLNDEVVRFKQVRRVLALMVEEDLVRRDTIIPLAYLPDLFMAVPVWYFYTDEIEQQEIVDDWETEDPCVHPRVETFCDLFPHQVWYDTFQLFNRRVRTLQQYRGEVIPAAIAKRMAKAVTLFDHVVIATPYHDEAGLDWNNPEWRRAIDPYVLGFKKGLPCFFVIGRFSDTGTFPLFNELLADTIEFLRTNQQKLKAFNDIYQPFWHHEPTANEPADDDAMYGYETEKMFGDYLMDHIDRLLGEFERGTLFDWLRGPNPEPLVVLR